MFLLETSLVLWYRLGYPHQDSSLVGLTLTNWPIHLYPISLNSNFQHLCSSSTPCHFTFLRFWLSSSLPLIWNWDGLKAPCLFSTIFNTLVQALCTIHHNHILLMEMLEASIKSHLELHRQITPPIKKDETCFTVLHRSNDQWWKLYSLYELVKTAWWYSKAV